jgi:ABC-2 type transport system ATP-binding protein
VSAGPGTPPIRVEGLGRRFGDRVAATGLSFDVQAGEVFGLLGPNGAGKTTTLRMLGALLRPSEGEAWVGGIPLSGDARAVRAQVGFLTEQPGLYDRLSAEDNLAFYARLYDVPSGEVAAVVEDALRRFGLWERRADRVGGFSKGMRQRLAIARALLHRPRVLLLDEPTSGLDPEAARAVRQQIAAMAAEGRAVLLSTHNLMETEQLCRRVGVIQTRLLKVIELDAAEVKHVEVEIAGGPQPAHAQLVARVPGVREARMRDGLLELWVEPGADPVPEALQALCAAGARVRSAVPALLSLEETYLELIAGARHGGSEPVAAPPAPPSGDAEAARA